MGIIEISHITKDYGNEKGVFDLSLSAERGEVVGFLGPNGAGKTTTIRQLMGFIRPQKGRVSIEGLDCFRDAAKISKKLGYLPGEIAFMEDMNGLQFIKFVGGMRGVKNFSEALRLMEFFELDAKGKIKRMSKGMKQKIAIICAFMGDPEILILDEPTSGLDPLMQSKFVELILSEKEKGKTIFMSSHIFEEIEKTCDRAAIIKNGRIVANENIETLRNSRTKTVDVRLALEAEAEKLAVSANGKRFGKTVTVDITGKTDAFIKMLAAYNVADIDIHTASLEDLFMKFYGENMAKKKDGGMDD